MAEHTPINLTIDHVTIAGDSLSTLEQTFDRVGLTPDYGGPHSNGITHMSLLGFDDGSYVELISTVKPSEPGESSEQQTAFWGEQIAANAGPCAWAVYVGDVFQEAKRVATLEIPIDGPHYLYRQRPDGKRVEWNLAFLGDGPAGATLPFIIKDITPRFLRVRPSASVSGQGLLSGLATVVLGVQNLPAAIDLFQRVYHWPAPIHLTDSWLEADLAQFDKHVVTLATPRGATSWLSRRLDQFGDLPCAYLLSTTDFSAACQTYNLEPESSWTGRRIGWFDPDPLDGLRLGVIE